MSITIIIIILVCLISFLGFKDSLIISKFLFSPYLCNHNKEYIRFISHTFIHADISHLLFNMLSFYMFGSYLENQLIESYGLFVGSTHFLILYFIGGIISTFWPYIRNKDNPNYSALGASGAVSSILFATLLWKPTMNVGLLFIPIPIPAYIFGPLYLAFEYWGFKKGRGNIAHDAHIGGAFFGIFYLLLINHSKGAAFLNHIF